MEKITLSNFIKCFESDLKMPQNKEELILKCYKFYLQGREDKNIEFNQKINSIFFKKD
jgi:hypothetical protein